MSDDNEFDNNQWVEDIATDFTKELADSGFTMRQMILLSRMQGKIFGLSKSLERLTDSLGKWMEAQNKKNELE